MSAIPVIHESQLTMSSQRPAVVARLLSTTRTWYLSLVAIGCGSALIAALISAYVQPNLRVHDEFSYLLAGDTILHGRLANPTPPAWEALQSFHTVMQPSYASKYPVGVGLLVAMGLLIGVPLASSWLGMALMTMSVTWMLAGDLPKRWAILGGVLLSLSPFIQLAWSQSLMNGFLPASGSALLMGGILRLRRRVAFASAFTSGCGVGLLAISRPFEGLCCTTICALILWFAWSRYKFKARAMMALQASAVASVPVLAALLLIAAHNQAVTGTWRQMPYQLHESQYGVAPLFVFAAPKLENTARRADLPEVFHEYHAVDSLNWYRERIGLHGWYCGMNDAFRELMKLAFPLAGLIAISGLGWSRYRLPQSLVLAIMVQVAASACVCWVYSHYLAPILPWILLLSLLSLRISLKDRSRFRKRTVQFAVVCVVLIQVICLGTFAVVAKSNEAIYWSRHRQDIVDKLNEAEGRHLVLVRYTHHHDVHQEWVYNLSQPGESKIVWARYEDGRWVDSLLKAYADRSVWVVDADEPQPRLKLY